MVKTLLAGVVLAATAASSLAAGSVTVSYSVSTSQMGLLYSGSFAGTDVDDDGLISFAELSSFVAAPTGIAQHYGLLPLTLADLVGFGDFDMATDTWVANGASWPNTPDAAYFTWNDGAYSFTSSVGVSVATTITSVTSVPEPAPLTLISLGALVLVRARKRTAV